MNKITDWAAIRRDGKRVIVVFCPKCGHRADLDHEISEDGRVSPSLICPNPTCDFHDFVELSGWSESQRELGLSLEEPHV